MPVQPLRFGTDGWRAVIGADYTMANVRLCAQAVADDVRARGLADRGLVVGYDTRFASEHFAAAAAEVLAANGVPALLCDRPTPTPVASFAVVHQRAAGAVMITASHNPAIWNGFKVRSDYGGAASPETLARLEARIADLQTRGTVWRMPADRAEQCGLLRRFDGSPAYSAHVGTLVDLETLRQAGLRVVVDAMYGAGMGWYPRLIGGGRTAIIELNAERNPYFGGVAPEPIPRNLGRLLHTVPQVQAQVGLATDGDADRLGVCDEHGRFIDQLRVYSLLALYLLEVRGWRGPIVKTISTSTMLDKLGALYNVPVYETPVGFKYVAPKMLETNALVGGEESGGYAFRGHIPERDGIVAGLFLLDMMVRLERTPSQLVEYLFSKVGPHFYDRLDLHFPAERRPEISQRLSTARVTDLEGSPVVRFQTEDGFKWTAADGSWLLIRFSGTEPIMRIYAETSSPERVQRLLQQGRELAGV